MSTNALKRGQTIQELTGYTDSIRITTADLTTAGASESLTFAVKAGQQVRSVAYKLHTAFSGGAASAVAIKVGDGTDDDGYFDADIFTGGPAYGPDAADAELAIIGKVYAADDNIDIVITATDDTVNDLTAGDIEIFFNIVDIDQFAGRQIS